jgi:putative oxidoreductase
MSVGLLILRIVVGLLFVGHGTQKLFGWFGGHGIDGTGGYFESLRYRNGPAMAVLAGLAEAGGGTLLVLGLLTWLGAAAIFGVMLNAMLSVHIQNGIWNSNGGVELPLAFSAAAICLAFTGPGRYSMDQAIGWHMAGWAWGLVAVILGAVVGGLTLASRSRPAAAGRHAAGDSTTEAA